MEDAGCKQGKVVGIWRRMVDETRENLRLPRCNLDGQSSQRDSIFFHLAISS